MLLHENKSVRQRPEEGYRRWFVNDYFDIILWYSRKGGELTGYQVCFSKNSNERAFSWKKDEYVSSHFVTDPDNRTGTSGLASNVLYGFAGTIPEEAILKLRQDKGELDDDIFERILQNIYAYNNSRRNYASRADDPSADFNSL